MHAFCHLVLQPDRMWQPAEWSPFVVYLSESMAAALLLLEHLKHSSSYASSISIRSQQAIAISICRYLCQLQVVVVDILRKIVMCRDSRMVESSLKYRCDG